MACVSLTQHPCQMQITYARLGLAALRMFSTVQNISYSPWISISFERAECLSGNNRQTKWWYIEKLHKQELHRILKGRKHVRQIPWVCLKQQHATWSHTGPHRHRSSTSETATSKVLTLGTQLHITTCVTKKKHTPTLHKCLSDNNMPTQDTIWMSRNCRSPKLYNLADKAKRTVPWRVHGYP